MAGAIYCVKPHLHLLQGDKRAVPHTAWVLLSVAHFTCTKGGVRVLVAHLHLLDKSTPPTKKQLIAVYPLLDLWAFFEHLQPTTMAVDLDEFYGGADHRPLSVYQEYLIETAQRALSKDKCTYSRLLYLLPIPSLTFPLLLRLPPLPSSLLPQSSIC